MAQLARPCSAEFKEDFAYETVKDRLPVILTKVIDTITQERKCLVANNGQDLLIDDLLGIISRLSEMKYSLQTNKPLKPLTDNTDSTQAWNKYFEEQLKCSDKPPSWYSSTWLFVECFFYRKIHEAIALSEHFKGLDPFAEQKRRSLTESVTSIASLACHLEKELNALSESNNDTEATQKVYLQILQVDLWGNKCDLSISGAADNHQTADPILQLPTLQSGILVDNSAATWQQLTDANMTKPNQVRVDIILDNSGFEFFTDLCLAVFLVDMKLASIVCLHGKCVPWFVSDVTAEDFSWTIDQLSVESDTHEDLFDFVKRLKQDLESGAITFEVHTFWTLPQDFNDMQTVAPDLYTSLQKSDLVYFKGDLNYRKLIGDRKWGPTTRLETAVREFRPAPFCALRTIKCDIQVGLRDGQMEEVQTIDPNWMKSSAFAVIQYLPGL